MNDVSPAQPAPDAPGGDPRALLSRLTVVYSRPGRKQRTRCLDLPDQDLQRILDLVDGSEV